MGKEANFVMDATDIPEITQPEDPKVTEARRQLDEVFPPFEFKGMDSERFKGNTVYILTKDRWARLAGQGFGSVEDIPWNKFGHYNAGYWVKVVRIDYRLNPPEHETKYNQPIDVLSELKKRLSLPATQPSGIGEYLESISIVEPDPDYAVRTSNRT